MTKNIIIRIGWLLLFFVTIAFFVYAGNVKNNALCKGIKVEVVGKKQYVFVNEDKIKNIVAANGGRVGYVLDSINLQKIEKVLYKDVWVKKADVFFDNNNFLQVKIDQSDPIARIFTTEGESFYIDSLERYLPINSKVTTRLPVFTSFPQNGLDDSLLIADIKKVSLFINRDTFWSSMFSQINIIKKNEFEIVPVLGNHLVYIGDASDLDNKFNKLYSFYKQVWINKGLDKYKKIDVEFHGQIVATLRDSTRKKDAVFGMPVNVYDSVNVAEALRETIDTIGFEKEKAKLETAKQLTTNTEKTSAKKENITNSVKKKTTEASNKNQQKQSAKNTKNNNN